MSHTIKIDSVLFKLINSRQILLSPFQIFISKKLIIDLQPNPCLIMFFFFAGSRLCNILLIQSRGLGSKKVVEWQSDKDLAFSNQTHMNFLPVPSGSWEENHQKKRTRGRLLLGSSLAFFGLTVYCVSWFFHQKSIKFEINEQQKYKNPSGDNIDQSSRSQFGQGHRSRSNFP